MAEKKTTKPRAKKDIKAEGNKIEKSGKDVKKTSSPLRDKLVLHEKRRHPRFLLSGEQFREIRSGKIFSVYDLSMTGLSIKVEPGDAEGWKEGSIIKGVLNLHPDSVEITSRVIALYGDRVALNIELASTYTRSVLLKALSPRRLGNTLKLVSQKLPMADMWFHGACNTDLLIKQDGGGSILSFEIYFANFFCSWKGSENKIFTGRCQSIGKEKREELLLNEEPVEIESIQVDPDEQTDSEKMQWAKDIIQSSNIDNPLKDLLLKKF